MTDAAISDIRLTCLEIALARHEDDRQALDLARRMAVFVQAGVLLAGEADDPTADASPSPSPITVREPAPPDAPAAPDAPAPAAPKPDPPSADPAAVIAPDGRRIGPASQMGRILALLRKAGAAGLDNGAIAEAMQMTRLRVSVAVCDLRKAGLVERLTGSDELRHRAVQAAAEPPRDRPAGMTPASATPAGGDMTRTAPTGGSLTDDERDILSVARKLAGAGARVTGKAIARATGHTDQRVRALLTRLEAKGYLKRDGNSNWNRNWRPIACDGAPAGAEPSGPEPLADPGAPTGGVVLPMRRQLPVPPERGRCAYPIGDPQRPGFAYCGAPTGDEAAVYCPEHHALCHQQRSQPRPSAER